MNIIISTKNKFELPEDLKEYIFRKLKKVLGDKDDPIVCEVILENLKKGRDDKKISITCSLGRVKKSVHVEECSEDFYSGADRAIDKFSRAAHNARR